MKKRTIKTWFLFCLVALGFVPSIYAQSDGWVVGAGKAEFDLKKYRQVLGGYVEASQIANGYLEVSVEGQTFETKLYSRAFYIQKGEQRVVYVLTDLLMISDLIRERVLDQVRRRRFSGINEHNLMLAATHTHAGPWKFSRYSMYTLPLPPFSPSNPTVNKLVDGIVLSIERAIESARPGSISVLQVDSDRNDSYSIGVNRSQGAFMNNPKAERDLFPHKVSTELTLLKLEDESEKLVGLVSWIPVHGTTLAKSNKKMSGDAKGLASLIYERNNPGAVVGFANSEAGDVSPHSLEAMRRNGEYPDVTPRTMISNALLQLRYVEENVGNCKKISESASLGARAEVRKISNIEFTNEAGVRRVLGKPSFGYSALSGAADGRTGDYEKIGEGVTSDQEIPPTPPFMVKLLRGAKGLKSPVYVKEQGAKAVVADLGEDNWAPHYLPFQILTIGHLAIVGFPGEITTVAGHRLKERVKREWSAEGVEAPIVTISSTTNAYASYFTTPEEYQAQLYEGASMLWGPYSAEYCIEVLGQLAGKR